jgi:hypothetical protein
MKQSIIALIFVALLSTWAGMAFAAPAESRASSLNAAAEGKCLTADGKPVYAEDKAGEHLIGFWPYYPQFTSNWWNGIVVGNISAVQTILKDTLCLVGVTEGGESVAKWHDQPIYPQQSTAFLKEDISSDENWKESLYFGVYAKNKQDDDPTYAFGLLGSKSGGGAVGAEFLGEDGITTDNAEDSSLNFAYLPGGKWWAAIVLVNFCMTNDAVLDVEVVHADGTAKKVTGKVKIKKGQMLVLTPEKLNALADDEDDPVKWDSKKTAYVKVTFNEEDESDKKISGWAQFGNGKGSVGYFGEKVQADDPA